MKFSISRIKMLLEEKIKEEMLDGVAEGKTIQDIYDKYSDVSQEDLEKEYEEGQKIEMEHTKDKEVAQTIARDHLWESPTYYTDLKRHVEKDGKELVEGKRKPLLSDTTIEDDDEDVDTETFERNTENSDKLQEILTHEELVSLCQYVELIYNYPVAEKHEAHNEGTSTESAYYIGEIKEDIVIKDKKIILKAGFFAIEKFVNTVPKIEPRVYIGSYETAEECIERLLDILIDLENRNADTRISIKQIDKEF